MASQNKRLIGFSSGDFKFQNQVLGHDRDHDSNREEDQDNCQAHSHDYNHAHNFGKPRNQEKLGSILVLRPHSGISGDIMVAGLAHMVGLDQSGLDELLTALGLGALVGRVKLVQRVFSGITGQGLEVNLDPEHHHRTLDDIKTFISRANLSERAKSLALSAFTILAEAEGRVHNLSPSEVHFHEVGALDSLLDIGLAAALFDRLNPVRFTCGPLPLCDGTIQCAHGLLSSPAPAVSFLLEGVMICGLNSSGETVTPTGLSLLKSFGAIFGPWPAMTVERQALIYGSRFLPNVANGALFAYGPATNDIDLSNP
ncbi:MAG: LarC family nickel insertion protein [Deltaproteobacteria bacterium]|nr:LarC family nickel insertion protein [Deltaproteobacteria bacterium]